MSFVSDEYKRSPGLNAARFFNHVGGKFMVLFSNGDAYNCFSGLCIQLTRQFQLLQHNISYFCMNSMSFDAYAYMNDDNYYLTIKLHT